MKKEIKAGLKEIYEAPPSLKKMNSFRGLASRN